MQKMPRCLLAALLCAPAVAHGADLHAHATLTSQYIYRGLSYSAGDPAVQAGADVAFDNGLFAGAWATNVDLTHASSQRNAELDLYAGYRWQSDAPLALGITALRYSYPGSEGDHDYDFSELLLSADWRDHLSIELALTDNVFNSGHSARHWVVRSRWPLADAWLLGAGVGGNDLSELGVPHYLHWDLGVSARLSRLTLDLRWYDNQRPNHAQFRYLGAGSQLVLSASLGL